MVNFFSCRFSKSCSPVHVLSGPLKCINLNVSSNVNSTSLKVYLSYQIDQHASSGATQETWKNQDIKIVFT